MFSTTNSQHAPSSNGKAVAGEKLVHGDSACGGCGDGEAQRVAKVEEGNAAAVGGLETPGNAVAR